MAARPRLPASLHVLRYRDFRRVALGNLCSQLGGWSRYVGIGWAARELTDSAELIGVAFSAQFVPQLLLAPFGGLIADRFDRRRVTMIGNITMGVPSVMIAALIQLDLLTFWALVALSFAGGLAGAVTNPSSQALVPHLVPPDEVHRAVALNSAMSNGSRFVGSGLAALIIGVFGTAVGFYFNAASFLAVVVAWWSVHPDVPELPQAEETFFRRLVGGFSYARRVPVVRSLVMLNIVSAFLIMHVPLLPIVVSDLLDSEVSIYAVLNGAMGLGAMGGAMFAGQWSSNDGRRRALGLGLAMTGIAIVTLGLSRWVAVSVLAQVTYGFGFFIVQTIVMSVLMIVTEDAYRGRVMALHMMTMSGVVPFNSIAAGYLAGWFGTVPTLVGAGVVLVTYTVWFVSGPLSSVRLDHSPAHPARAPTPAPVPAA